MRTDLQEVFDLWSDANLQDITVAMTMYLISVVIAAYRWQILLVAKQVPMAIRRAISLYFIGNFFTNFLPTSIGGDAVRAYSAGADMDNRMDALASVFIERFIGLFSIVFLALLGLLLVALQLEQTYIVPLTIVLFITNAAVFPILFSRWCVDWFQPVLLRITMFDIGCRATRLHEVLYKYGEHPQEYVSIQCQCHRISRRGIYLPFRSDRISIYRSPGPVAYPVRHHGSVQSAGWPAFCLSTESKQIIRSNNVTQSRYGGFVS